MRLQLQTLISLHWVIIIIISSLLSLKGYGKLGSRLDTRMPITLSILRIVLQPTSTACASEYRAYLFEAMCITVFFAFLRVGEITCCPRSSTVLQLNQIVKLVDSSGSITGFKISFLDFKHSYKRPNVSITLKRRSDICPVQSLLDYFHVALYQMALFFELTTAMRFTQTF